MNAQQQQLLDELTAAIRRQPDCASLSRYGGRIKTLIAANEGTREEITPEMYGLLRSAYAVRKREIEANEEQEPSESKIAIAVCCLTQSRDTHALESNYVQCQMQFGANLPPEIDAAYEQRSNELEQIFEQQKAEQKLSEFGLEFGDMPDAAQALGAAPAGGANDFPYCD